MNNKIKKFFIAGSIFFSLNIHADTLVYNLKIRRTLDIAAELNEGDTKFVASMVPVVSMRKRHIVDDTLGVDLREKSIIGGSLFNLRRKAKPWWVEVTTAIAKQGLHSRGTTTFNASRTGFDDTILAAGYNKPIGKKVQINFYALAGFPTHSKVSLKDTYDTLVGTRFYSIGGGIEFDYAFVKEEKQSLTVITQARFIHFFDRFYTPILLNNEKIQPGNLTDLLLVLQYRRKTNILEVLYNPTFFTNEAVLLLTGKVKGPNYVRNAIDVNLTHLLPHAITLNYGTSLARSERYSIRIIKYWINFSIAF